MMTPANWLPPPPKLSLADDEVHVWLAALDLDAQSLLPMEALLSADEREKAARFRFEKDRKHYTAGRGILRSILARYLQTDPAGLQFSANTLGKPSLSGGAKPPLRFNLSHSHGLAL